MNEHTTNSVVTLASGRVKLSAEQAAARRHCLKEIKKGAFEIVSPIQFKAGETFGYDGDLPKVYVGAMANPDVRATKKKAAAKQAAEEAGAEEEPEPEPQAE